MALAAHAGVHLQLSGLGMFSDTPRDAFRPAAELAFDAFGPDRLLWGSDFPMSGEDARGHAAEFAPYQRDAFPFAREHLPAILGGRCPAAVIPAFLH